MATVCAVPPDYPKEIIGYVQPWITDPGSEIAVKVCECITKSMTYINCKKISSTEKEYSYRLIRLIQGHEDEHAPKVQEEVINAVPAGTGRGRFQQAISGSYGIIKDLGFIEGDSGIELSLFTQPWLINAGHIQCLVSTLDHETKCGFELLLEEGGELVVLVGTKTSIAEIHTSHCLAEGEWVKLDLKIQGTSVTIQTSPVTRYAQIQLSSNTHTTTLENPLVLNASSWLLLAASQLSNSNTSQNYRANFYNGKIEAVMVKTLGTRSRDVVELDFSQEIPTDNVIDVSGCGRHGKLINAPARAVTGHKWDGSQPDWTKAPCAYGAIHFHDDDLDDACWETDFKILLPESLRSGAYAIEVRGTSNTNVFDKITFFVRRNKMSTAKVALICSTFTYQAYANERMYDKDRSSRLPDPNPDFEILEDENYHKMVRRTDLGLSLYDVHRDGSGTVYSSVKRPILNVRPGFQHWAFKRPREFSADLIMIGFLEKSGFDYDVCYDHDLHKKGVKHIAQYYVVISGSHPEYPSLESLNAWTHYAQQGGNIMYLGGNGFYWISMPDPKDFHRLEVRRGDQGVRTVELPGGERHHSINGVAGGLWRTRGRAANFLFGVGCCAEGIGPGAPYKRTEAAADPKWSWIFDSISDDELLGEHGFGGPASGDEIDRFDIKLGSPKNAVVLATSTGHSDDFGLMPEESGFPMINTLGTQTDQVRSDMVIYQTSGGGHVFSIGSMNWYNSLGWDGYANNIATLTGNLIKGFLAGR